MIFIADMCDEQKCQLLTLLKKEKRVIAWKIYYIKGINHIAYMHRILLEENDKNNIERQRRLNLIMKDVVKNEIIN